LYEECLTEKLLVQDIEETEAAGWLMVLSES